MSDRQSKPQISEVLFSRATQVIPGGVNSPVRAFKSVGGTPLFIERAVGPYVFDIDGRRYIDFVGSWGPMILGHNAAEIRGALISVLERGTSFGAPTELEVELAELIVTLIPSVEMVRLVNSGTEATMTAIRLARGFTGRDYIVKFNGCYHGHADSLLVEAGSGVATCGIAGSAGVPAATVKHTLSVEFNDTELLRQTLNRVGPEQIAAIIVEPVPGNMGLVPPQPGYLESLRDVCDEHGILLIFDEVMTGFRVALGGAQQLFGVVPDLTTFGKVIGGGLPVGALGGRREIMEQLAPLGPVYQAGTLSGNPLAVAAGLAALKRLKAENPYAMLEKLTTQLVDGLQSAAGEHGIDVRTTHCGSMFGLFFSNGPIRNYSDVKQSNTELFRRYFHGMLKEGVYLAPSAFEAGFVSSEHSEAIIQETIDSASRVFGTMRI